MQATNFNLHLMAMKKLLFLAILSCIGSMAFAQKVYFVYIQSEGGIPFYVKLGDKVYSSTASGYLILSKLKDSTYSIYLGQPGNQVKELRFSVTLNNSDHGFLLKNFQNEWALFDLQSMAIINPAPSTSGVMYESNVVKNDLFTRLLAKAVDDSTLLMEPVLAKRDEIKQTKKEDLVQNASIAKDETVTKVQEDVTANQNTTPKTSVVESTPVTIPNQEENVIKDTASKEPVVQTETAASQKSVAPKEPITSKDSISSKEIAVPNKETIVQNTTKVDSNLVETSNTGEIVYKRSVVKKYAESSNFQGFGLTFIDTWEGVTDTIRLMIPNVVDANSIVRTELPKSDKQTSDISNVTNEKDSSKTSAVSNTNSQASCKKVASDNDFQKLKKNMAARERGEEMLVEARSAFTEKCFTTEQIRKLSTLFLTQEGKLLFFKDAKAHISDKDRFNTLLFELNEDAYMERFKSLLEN
jgi:hypothetical protein